jgi:glycosyltransferase involved in cell wall biosynthesis
VRLTIEDPEGVLAGAIVWRVLSLAAQRDVPMSVDPTTNPRVSVLIAAFNEHGTIEEVIRRVADQPFESEIIVVDDGSVDDTAAVVEELIARGVDGLQLMRHESNRGKGAAIRTAIDTSRGDTVVIQDADLEYDPHDLPRLLAPILDGHADVVYGTRLRGGEPQRAHVFWHYAGNRALSLLTNILFNTTISDIEVGYKAFKGDLIRSLELERDDFGFEAEVTAKILKLPDVRLYEVPISYFGRTYGEGKKITWRDGVKAVAVLARERMRS